MLDVVLGVIGSLGFLVLGGVLLTTSYSLAIEFFTAKDKFIRVLACTAFFPIAYMGLMSIVGAIVNMVNLVGV